MIESSQTNKACSRELAGSVAIVTGASRGIGRVITKAFANEGARVVINYVSSYEEAKRLGKEIEENGGKSLVAKADVSNSGQVKTMVSRVLAVFGRIDILVNNAAIQIPRDFIESTESDWDKTIETNLKGAYLCCKAVVPIMLKQGGGKIINISSISGLADRPAARYVDYAASKAGLIGLTRSLAYNLAPIINVNAVCPGTIESDPPRRPTRELDERIQATPMKRLGRPEEVANAVLFLASKKSDYVTGEIIVVSGGRAMR